MSVCGRCRGRRVVKPTIGFGDKPCPDCKGTGVKQPKASLGSKTVSVPLTPGARCIVCGELAVHQHHVIAQQRLSRHLTADKAQYAKTDVRNVVPLCFECHHRVEQGSLQLAEHELHPGFRVFVDAYDLEAALPRHLAEARS